MNNGNQFLGTERIGKLMGQYAVPCIISLLVGALYNIVDQIFIANASYLGSYGNAANTVVFPLTVVALAIAVMVGDGCCAFVSMALGRGEMEKAKRSVGNAVVLSVASSLVLTAVYLIFADGIIAMFGGTVNEETFHHSQEYFFYITLGIPFYMFGQAMNPIIRADGNPRFAMISTLAGAVINIILDPIFIFIFQWGMMGAAVATVIGQVATAFLAVWYLLHMKIIKPASGDYALRGSVCGRMLTLGITSFLSQISLVAAMAAINNMLRKYGALDAVFGQEQYAQIPMAVVGIVMKFFQIVISIVVGMAAGCIPIVGYNMGAEKKLRVRELFTRLLMAETLVGAVALMLAEGFPRQLISIFGAANESSYYTDFAIKAFRTYLLHDGAGLRQQGVLYLPAGGGQSAGIHAAVHVPRGGVRRGLCPAAACVLRLGRCAVFHADVGSSDLCHLSSYYCENLSGAAYGRRAGSMKSSVTPPVSILFARAFSHKPRPRYTRSR